MYIDIDAYTNMDINMDVDVDVDEALQASSQVLANGQTPGLFQRDPVFPTGVLQPGIV